MSGDLIDKRLIIEDAVEKIYQAYPNLIEQYGEAGVERCREDNMHHLEHLDTAFQLNNHMIFIDYTNWLKELLVARGMSTEHIEFNFEVLRQWMGNHQLTFYELCLEKAIETLRESN
ncbi:hypothetical protein [Gracilibacillus salinarum]|uniref:Uncharacterized protein n=1 Tax=Gracilibacillus salinarum TaxID=2932255 RepID=A0ABY4GQE0_9BACI|nr:hypothetical protein [Gracilibacillus salinarum]UOQ86436.1 hypothetical protein MUN87_05990 [Gracilibacillus salinarum]